jgi:hypothetical protein
MRSKLPAPTSCATSVFIAIMVPTTVTTTIDQIAAPVETAASSAALVWPVMATSATAMPTVASCPISTGQANFHSAVASLRRWSVDVAVGMCCTVGICYKVR